MTKLKYLVAKNDADLNLIQGRAVKATHKARDLVQIALVATIIHLAQHGNRTVADQFVAGLGNTVNSAAVVEWFVQFGGLTVNEEGTGFGGWQGADYIKDNLNREGGAKDTMWWELKKVNPFKGYNADAEIMRLVKNYKAMQAKAQGDDADKINLTISDESIKALLNLANFNVLIEGEAANGDEVVEMAA